MPADKTSGSAGGPRLVWRAGVAQEALARHVPDHGASRAVRAVRPLPDRHAVALAPTRVPAACARARATQPRHSL